ncbi:MAG TPA: MG2 domain-containing protein, partial [Prosthecobacter sp.]|nr:MG2 domain-containing protein [Prosthecobacter sp.]
RHVWTVARDRVRQLQLFDRALKAQPPDAPAQDRKALLEEVGSWFNDVSADPGAAWSLLALTDLTKLPEYDDQTGLDDPAGGYPVDADGNPIFFKLPTTWDAAANDGERLRWVMSEWAKIDAESRYEAQQLQVELASSWFSVSTISRFGLRFADENEDEGQRRAGISALHTLKDDETVANLATGPKRFTLPAEWAFLNLARSLAEDNDAPKDVRRDAWEEIAGELTHRRQFGRAAEAHEKALALTGSADEKASIEASIKQIRANLGNLESQLAQPAGREAKLQLVFRNAQKVSLTARRVDSARLLADTEAYLRSAPQEIDWQDAHLQSIGQRLIDEKNNKYLSEVTARWEQKLEPRADHWDRRTEVPTPLKAAGAWWIEATFEGGHQARALLWIEDIVIVQTNQAGLGHYFVADAVTGAPVPGAAVKFFGWRQEWKDSRVFQQKPRYTFDFKDHQAVTDAKGQATLPQSSSHSYQWLVVATTKSGSQAFLGFEHLWFGNRFEDFGEQTRLYTITDRPVYRPSQELKWQAWARSVGYGTKMDANRFKGARIEVLIHDPRGEKILERTYTADDFGAIGDTLVLGPEAILGQYQMSMTWKRTLRSNAHLGGHFFRVEEYKKPEFEVKVAAPTVPVALGDAFEVKVKADYYFGGPVKEGKVKYKVQRTVHNQRWFPPGPWDWLFGAGYNWRGSFYDWYPGSQNWCRCMPPWPWWPQRSEPPELIVEGEAPLNPDGTFTVKVDTTLAKELHGDEDHRYEIEAQVTDQSRRMIVGNGVVLAARRPFEVYVWSDRGYYQAGEGGEIRIAARTLDGKSVAARGKLRLLRVTYDAAGNPKEEEVSSFDIKTGADETK